VTTPHPDNSKTDAAADPLTVMLEARTIALVGASPRPGTLGARMIDEVAKSPSRPRGYMVNPRYDSIGGERAYPALGDLPESVDLALLAVPDAALEDQVRAAASGAARSLVIFGSAAEPVTRSAPEPVSGSAPEPVSGSAGRSVISGAQTAPRNYGHFTISDDEGPGLRERIAATARAAGLAVCGAGCMGFVNIARGLRATGYIEPDPLPSGPVAVVTHSGSVFSALLRIRRAFGFTVAVSSGQELVTPAAAYARYALTLPETRVLAFVLEAIRDAPLLRTVLGEAAARDIPVLLLAAGTSAASSGLVAAHSGALAAGDGAWQALARAYGVHRVGDLAELADTLELFCAGRRALGSGQRGIATVHDSGFERAHVADVAAAVGVPFAPLKTETKQRLAAVLDPGLEPGNPLDVWGTGRDSETLFTEALSALADDPGVGAVALAVDLVPEFDGDESYRDAVLAAAARTDKPVAVLASVFAAIDQSAAIRLRQAGVPVLESTRTGLLALRHLLNQATTAPPTAPAPSDGCGSEPAIAGSLPHPSNRGGRSHRAAALFAGPLGPRATLGATDLFAMLRDYGIPTVETRTAETLEGLLTAAGHIGYPVALKTDAPGISHKSDVDGVHLAIPHMAALTAVYTDLTRRLGPQVTVSAMAAPGTEVIIGMARDPALGPLLVLGPGGLLAEFYPERTVALPPLTEESARRLIETSSYAWLLAGVRGQPPVDIQALAAALTSLSELVADLGDHLDAFDVNPLICGPAGVLAVDALAVTRQARPVR
jgi:acyl-CoA synthetase (NDP forming)